MRDIRSARWFWPAFAVVAPVLAAAGLVPLRGHVGNANIALLLVVVVVVAAERAGREVGAIAAVAAALSFDFFQTRPYLRIRIDSSDDVETTLLLVAVGLVVGHIAARGRVARERAEAAQLEVRRVYRVGNLGARGDDPTDVIMAAQAELLGLLRLVDCRFEAPPFEQRFDRLARNGLVAWRPLRLREGGLELPASGAELPVLGRGQVLGRFVLYPTPGTGVSLEERVVAIALADQVGAVLAAPQPGERRHAHG